MSNFNYGGQSGPNLNYGGQPGPNLTYGGQSGLNLSYGQSGSNLTYGGQSGLNLSYGGQPGPSFNYGHPGPHNLTQDYTATMSTGMIGYGHPTYLQTQSQNNFSSCTQRVDNHMAQNTPISYGSTPIDYHQKAADLSRSSTKPSTFDLFVNAVTSAHRNLEPADNNSAVCTENTSMLPSSSAQSSAQVTAASKDASATHSQLNHGTNTVVNVPEAPKSKTRVVVVKDLGGNHKKIAVKTSSGNSAVLPRPTPVLKLSDTVEQEISNMIQKTCASFTISGDAAKESGLLEQTLTAEEFNQNSCGKFFCRFCKERYNEKVGFQYHLQRISFVLKYKCSECVMTFTFFNKCALWAHISRHKDPSLHYNNVLRLDPFNFTTNPHVYDTTISSIGGTDSKEILKKVMGTSCGMEKCPMCSEFVKNIPVHLKRPDYKNLPHLCEFCNMTLPNKCSLKAHKLIIQKKICIMACPECGHTWNDKPSTSMKDVFDHLDSCSHFNRTKAFTCECGLSFPMHAEARKHYADAHTKRLSKCHACCVAFTDSKLLDMHYARNPSCQRQTARNKAKNVTLLCMLCKTVMINVEDAVKHVEKHVSNRSEVSWQCFLCSMMFPTAYELQRHADEDHPHKARRCTVCFRLFCNRKLLVEHIMKKTCNPNLRHNLRTCFDMPPGVSFVHVEKMFKAIFQDDQTTNPVSVGARKIGSSSSLSSAQSKPKDQSKSKDVASELSPQTSVSEKEQASKQAESQPSTSGQSTTAESAANTESSTEERTDKVAVRKPPAMDKQTSELLTEMQQWVSNNGQEIVPTKVPTVVKKKGKPKGEVQPPVHLVCGVTMKGVMYQCHPCKIIVLGTKNYLSHMKYHEEKGDVNYGPFCRCSVCEKLISSQFIIKHLKDHQESGIVVCCRCQKRNFGSIEDAVQHARNLCGYRKIGQSETSPLDTGAYQSSSSESPNKQTGSPGRTLVNKRPAVSVESIPQTSASAPIPVQPSSLHPCHLCRLAFENIVLRDQHVRKAHGGTCKVYHCLACRKKKIVKTFASETIARRHVTKKHRIVQTSLIDRCLKEVVGNVGCGSGSASTPSAQTVRVEDIEADDNGEDAADKGPVPKQLRLDGQGEFLCGKCGFSCSSDQSETFKQHVGTHNLSGEPQCPECGLCFTVLAAVRRHLFTVHKIKDLDKYLQEKGLQEENEEEDQLDEALEEMLPDRRSITTRAQHPDTNKDKDQNDDDDDFGDVDMDTLECNVCYRSFDTQVNLKTHMRTHGMAFIKSKRSKPI